MSDEQQGRKRRLPDVLKRLRTRIRKRTPTRTGDLQSHDRHDRHEEEPPQGRFSVWFRRLARRRRTLCEASWAHLAEGVGRLLTGGVPLLEAVHYLAATGRRKEQVMAARLREHLYAGHPLSVALTREAAPLTLRVLVEVGEHNGDLPGSLLRAARHGRTRVQRRRDSVHAALYPLLVGCVLLVVCWFLFTHALPQFATLYAGMGLHPTGTTAWLLAFANHLPPLLFLTVLLLTFLLFLTRTWPRLRHLTTQILTRLPWFHRYLQVGRTLEWSSTLGLLLDGGLPLLRALDIQAQLPLHPSTLTASHRISQQIRTGLSLSHALRQESFDSSLALAVHVAEATGDLPRALLFAEQELDRQRQAMTQTLVKLVEPGLLVIAGGLVGLVAWLMLVPMLDLMQTI